MAAINSTQGNTQPLTPAIDEPYRHGSRASRTYLRTILVDDSTCALRTEHSQPRIALVTPLDRLENGKVSTNPYGEGNHGRTETGVAAIAMPRPHGTRSDRRLRPEPGLTVCVRQSAGRMANEKTFTRLSMKSIDESGLGDPETRPRKRLKIYGILRDVCPQKSMGVIEEIPEKGIVKYAKPAGVIAALVPVTNAALTEAGMDLRH